MEWIQQSNASGLCRYSPSSPRCWKTDRRPCKGQGRNNLHILPGNTFPPSSSSCTLFVSVTVGIACNYLQHRVRNEFPEYVEGCVFLHVTTVVIVGTALGGKAIGSNGKGCEGWHGGGIWWVR